MEQDDVVSAFLEAARAFRYALATDEITEQPEFARGLRNAVACVYVAAARLPRGGAVPSDDHPSMDDTPSTTADRAYGRALEGRIRARLGRADTFVDVWDPTDRAARVKTIERSLAQELVEIDEDLERCVTWLEEPREADPLWDVWFAFDEHWGKHAVDVLRPLHHIARGSIG